MSLLTIPPDVLRLILSHTTLQTLGRIRRVLSTNNCAKTQKQVITQLLRGYGHCMPYGEEVIHYLVSRCPVYNIIRGVLCTEVFCAVQSDKCISVTLERSQTSDYYIVTAKFGSDKKNGCCFRPPTHEAAMKLLWDTLHLHIGGVRVVISIQAFRRLLVLRGLYTAEETNNTAELQPIFKTYISAVKSECKTASGVLCALQVITGVKNRSNANPTLIFASLLTKPLP